MEGNEGAQAAYAIVMVVPTECESILVDKRPDSYGVSFPDMFRRGCALELDRIPRRF
jgi:hypothetical protein